MPTRKYKEVKGTTCTRTIQGLRSFDWQKLLILSSLILLLAVLKNFLSKLLRFGIQDVFDLHDKEFHKQKLIFGVKPTFNQTFASFTKSLGEEKRYICTGGVDPSSLSEKEFAKAFAEGPCAPTILVPGLTGSRLRVVIDCEILQKTDRKTFRACGWNTCKKWSIFRPYYKAPRNEYMAWIPSLFGPLNLIPQTDNTKKCFMGLFTPVFEFKNNKAKLIEKPGVKVLPIGMTPETRSLNIGGCGRSGMDNYSPIAALKVHAMDYQELIISSFEFIGHRVGLSLQPYPFDFRLHYSENNLTKRLENIVSTLHSMYSKKTLIVGHSMGNLLATNLLWTMPQDLKDKAISRFIALGAPLMGVDHAVYGFIGFDQTLTKTLKGIKIGLGTEIKANSFSYFGSYYDLFIKNTFIEEADKPYIKAIVQRAQSEHFGTPMPKGTIMDLFPPPSETCARNLPVNPWLKEKFDKLDKYVLGMLGSSKIGYIEGKVFRTNEISELLEEYSFNHHAKTLYELYRDERFTKFPNPGVQTNVVFSRGILTKGWFNFSVSPKSKTEAGKISLPNFFEPKPGDGIVTTTSALTPFIKWADDFRNGEKHSRPVNFIEMCGLVDRRESVFDNKKEKKVEKNAYFGIECTCDQKNALFGENDCRHHFGMLSDLYLSKFIIKSSIDGQTGSLGQEFCSLPDSFFEDFSKNCDLLNNT